MASLTILYNILLFVVAIYALCGEICSAYILNKKTLLQKKK